MYVGHWLPPGLEKPFTLKTFPQCSQLPTTHTYTHLNTHTQRQSRHMNSIYSILNQVCVLVCAMCVSLTTQRCRESCGWRHSVVN